MPILKTTTKCCSIWSGLLTSLLCTGIVYSTIQYSPYISKIPHTVTHVNLFISNGYNTFDRVDGLVNRGYSTMNSVNSFIGNISQLQGEITNITEMAYPILKNTQQLVNSGEITLRKINQISSVANRTLYDIQELIILLKYILNSTRIPSTREVVQDLYISQQEVIPSTPPLIDRQQPIVSSKSISDRITNILERT